MADDASENAIREVIGEVSPQIVFLPHGNDTNTGHQRNYTMFRRITYTLKHPIRAFYIRDPKTIEFPLLVAIQSTSATKNKKFSHRFA